MLNIFYILNSFKIQKTIIIIVQIFFPLTMLSFTRCFQKKKQNKKYTHKNEGFCFLKCFAFLGNKIIVNNVASPNI